jgi:hypothetical protein
MVPVVVRPMPCDLYDAYWSSRANVMCPVWCLLVLSGDCYVNCMVPVGLVGRMLCELYGACWSSRANVM